MSLGYAVYAADRTLLTSMLSPLSSGLGLTGLQQGLLVSAQYIGVLSVVFLAGSLSDRYGKWRIILGGVVVFSAFTWLIGLSENFAEAFAFRLVSGMGEGMFWPVAMSAVATSFGSSRGFALGAFYVGFDLGGASGTAIGGLAFSITSDWRTAFFVAPLLGVAVIAGLFLTRGVLERQTSRAGMPQLGRESLGVLGRSGMPLVLVFAFLVTYPVAAWQSFLPTYFKSVLGLGVSSAAYAASGVLLAGALGKLVLGRASDRRRRNRVLLAMALGTFAMFAVFFSTSTIALGIAAGMAAGFVGSAIFPVMQALAADSGGGMTGTALGLTTTFQSLATVLSPTITSLFFPQGVGAAVAYNVMVPMVGVVLVAFLLRDPKRSAG